MKYPGSLCQNLKKGFGTHDCLHQRINKSPFWFDKTLRRSLGYHTGIESHEFALTSLSQSFLEASLHCQLGADNRSFFSSLYRYMSNHKTDTVPH